jgi:hypothetical protein
LALVRFKPRAALYKIVDRDGVCHGIPGCEKATGEAGAGRGKKL